jgi:hypothetical protein
LNNGKSFGISVLLLKESILKVIKLWKCSEKYNIFFLKILITFGSHLIYLYMYTHTYMYDR